MTATDSDHAHAAKAAIAAAFALAACVSLLDPARAQIAPAGEQTADGSVAQPAQAKPAPAPGSAVNGMAERHDQPTAIRLIPPSRGYRELRSGRVEIQTLIIDPSITTVEFSLDGRRTERVTEKPYTTHVELADPPREQTLEVRGYDAQGKHLGSDSIILNGLDAAFAVRIVEIRHMQASGYATVRVEAAVSVPRSASLERVEFYRGQHLVEALRNFGEEAAQGAPRTIAVEVQMESVPADDFVRVVAKLADGREWEDAELLQGADYRGEIDVQLVQLQVQVTDRNGNPASNLKPDDFDVRENGERRVVAGQRVRHAVRDAAHADRHVLRTGGHLVAVGHPSPHTFHGLVRQGRNAAVRRIDDQRGAVVQLTVDEPERVVVPRHLVETTEFRVLQHALDQEAARLPRRVSSPRQSQGRSPPCSSASP